MASARPICKFDLKCYRKNPEHFKEYAHPLLEASKAKHHAAAATTTTPKAAPPKPSVPPPPASHHSAPKTPPKPSSTIEDLVDAALRGRPLMSPSPSKRNRSDASADARDGLDSAVQELLCAMPPPRASPLGTDKPSRWAHTPIAPSEVAEAGALLHSVFEMPFDAPAIAAVYNAALAADAADPLSAFGAWRLVGVFEVLHGLIFASDAEKWTKHRFRYDPPEVHTFAVSRPDGDIMHLAFHRDDPAHLPSLVVSGSASSNAFTIEGGGGDIAFALLHSTTKKLAGEDKLKAIVSARPPPPGGATPKQHASKLRNRQSLASTFHGLGVSVPYDKKTEIGYRPMLLSRSRLSTILKAINTNASNPKAQEELDEQLGLADIANDESDFGLNVELGLNFFAMVVKPNSVFYHAHRILDMAYMLLGRDLFRHILRCHLPALAGGRAKAAPKVVAPPAAALPAPAVAPAPSPSKATPVVFNVDDDSDATDKESGL